MPITFNGVRYSRLLEWNHTVEVGQAGLALDIFTDQAELPEVELRVVQVAERDLEHAALEEVGRNF